MMLHYQEPNATVYCGHALDLKELPAESVDMSITSPPYWGLRTYKTEPQIWGDNNCEHEWGDEIISKANDSNRGTMEWKTGGNPATKVLGEKVGQGSFCLKCNAWRGELGLEPTIELYISHLIQIFNEVKRVLKKTGTLFVNIDDSYSGIKVGNTETKKNPKAVTDGFIKPRIALPDKSLCLIPQRFAIAMVEQGWILRNDIVWNKPNPMPESAKDRFTGSWEHLYFFVKNKRYFFEQQLDELAYIDRRGNQRIAYDGKLSKQRDDFNIQPVDYFGQPPEGRNKRDVWEITTQGYPEAHFATFPEKLCETPILAGCPLNGVVLDPFCGSGTTLAVAKRLNRKGIGVDINPDYCKLATKRLQEIPIPMDLRV